MKWDGVFWKVLVPLVASPLLGITMGFLFMVVLLNVFRRANPQRLNHRFRRLQVLSAGYMAFSHGSNDAQKTMGIMTLALLSAGVIDDSRSRCRSSWSRRPRSRSAPRSAAGGSSRRWASASSKLDPVHGFAAETTAATIIFAASHVGAPVSTTHVISTAIMGVGSSTRRLGGPLGRRGRHRDGLGPHDPGRRASWPRSAYLVLNTFL